jgi:hypothetical protein
MFITWGININKKNRRLKNGRSELRLLLGPHYLGKTGGMLSLGAGLCKRQGVHLGIRPGDLLTLGD